MAPDSASPRLARRVNFRIDLFDRSRRNDLMHAVTRSLVLGALSSAAVAGPVVAQGGNAFSYSPGTHRYRVTTVVHSQRDQTGGRAPLQYDVTTKQVVTVTLTPKSRDVLKLAIRIDSVDVQSEFDAVKPDVSFERGVTLEGTVAPNGRIIEFGSRAEETKGNLATSNVAALYKSFQHLLLAFPTTPVQVGSTWADTTHETVFHRSSFDSVVTETATTWKVAGDTTVGGQHAWRVERNSTIGMSGDGHEAGQDIHLDGDGTIKSVSFVNPAGIYLGARSSQTVRLVSSFKETGEGAPQTQSIKSTIEPLPPVRTADKVENTNY
jgi:hypothetical protein